MLTTLLKSFFNKGGNDSRHETRQDGPGAARGGVPAYATPAGLLQVLHENEEGPNPEEIYRQGEATYAPLGLVTAYRTLDLLTELGIARRVDSEQHCHGYASSGARRHYLICENVITAWSSFRARDWMT